MPNGSTIGPEGNGGSTGGGGGSINTLTSSGGTITVSAPTGPTTNVDVANQAGVTPGTYGDATHVAAFTVDAQGIVTAVSNVGITGGGTVTSVSVASANGLSGTVANPTTTPAITLAPTFTGIAYSSGTALAAAIASNFPTLNQNTTGTAGNLSGTPALPNGTTATTQSPGDSTTKLATDAFVAAAVAGLGTGSVTSVSVVTANGYSGTVATATTTPAITLTGPAALPPNGSAGGVLAGTYPNPTLAGVITAGGPTGSATVVPVLTYNAAGQLTAVTTATIAPTILPSQYTTLTITSDPNPAVIGTYYRLNYTTGNFTLPSTSLTIGQWIRYKFIATSGSITIVGTIDGVTNPTVSTRYQSGLLIWNGTNWDND